jgi:hypothetical protein
VRLLKATAIAILCIGTWSCGKSGGSGEAVARVGENYLTWQELREVIPDNSSPRDSVSLAERYIQEWIKQQVVLNKAALNLEEEKKNFDDLIENYRRSLLTYAYEQQVVKQLLDTVVKPEEIEKYYNDNVQNFQLRDYIVKIKFCAVGTDNKQIKPLRKLFTSKDPQDLVKWEKLCVEIGASYYFDEDKWMLWDDFITQVPLTVVDKESFLKKNKEIEFEKDNNLYLLSIVDYQISGSQSPLSFETEKIRGMIINNRKQLLLAKMREDLYNQANQNHEIEIFTAKK